MWVRASVSLRGDARDAGLGDVKEQEKDGAWGGPWGDVRDVDWDDVKGRE